MKKKNKSKLKFIFLNSLSFFLFFDLTEYNHKLTKKKDALNFKILSNLCFLQQQKINK